MSSSRFRGGHHPPQQSYASYPPQHRDDFYDDRRSASRSPDQRYSSPHRRRSPPHDRSRPANNSGKDGNYERGYKGRSPDRRYDNSHDARDYSTSPPRRRNYHDPDQPYSDSHRRSRSRGRSLSSDAERPSSRGKPNKEIIMEGLAPHLTEKDISTELRQHYHIDGLEDVRVIRDRQTKKSRQFGFLRFPSLEEAEDFLERNYPIIYLYGDQGKSDGSSESSRVRIAYGRERKEGNRGEESDWICTTCNINNYATRARCFRCQAYRSDQITAAKVDNAGDNDASPDNTPSQYLLLRGLEPSVSEELLVKGVAKLNKPSGPSAGSNQSPAKKGGKIASTTGDANLGARDGSLLRVLLVRDRRSNESWRYGFAEYASIEDAHAALTRYNSFDRFTIASKQVLVTYIHAGVFVPVLNPSASTKRFSFSPLGNPSLKLSYWDEDAYVTELAVSSSEPQASDVRTTKSRANIEGIKSMKDAEKSKKRKAQPDATVTGTKKPAPSHLQFWSNRHAEIHGIDKSDTTQAASKSDNQPAPPSQSYADLERHCCYLCMKQFTTSAEVNKHERLSELHRQNLKDETKVQKAQNKLEKHGLQQQSTPATEYRDRARERRKVYGVVNKKGEQVGNIPKDSKQLSDEDESAAPAKSKGASLLSKMGYVAGQGLGASGEGMVAPINQDVYVAGVGLGAQGGKLGDAVAEAEKNTKGDYSNFVESAKQGARERYARM